MSIELLKTTYAAAPQLIEFTKQVRGDENKNNGKYSVKLRDLEKLFQSADWKKIKTASGHRKFVHLVTGTVVGFKAHDTRGNVDPAEAMTVLQKVQAHLNELHNDIFAWAKKGWKTEPDYKASLERLNALPPTGNSEE